VKAEALNAEHGTILAVDDDSATRRALHMTLSGMGFTVVDAARGEEALSLARVTRFDAVLLDVDMPGMGGLEACRAIRHAVPRLPILMLTVMDGAVSIARVDGAIALRGSQKECSRCRPRPANSHWPNRT
jgi:CheY-like chemotaxis protein